MVDLRIRGRAASYLLGAFTATSIAQDTVVTIGHVAPLSGHQAALGKDNENGVRMALEELNSQDITIGGRKIKFELRGADDAADPKQGAAVAQIMCNSKVAAVVGHFNSSTALAASKVYADCGIPHILGAATNPNLTRSGSATTFRVVADDNAQSAVLAEYVVNAMKLNKVALIDDHTAFSEGVVAAFKQAALAKGMRIVSEVSNSDRATDFGGVLGSIKFSKPEAIFFAGTDAQAGSILRQLDQAGMTDVKFIAGAGTCTTELPQFAAGVRTLTNVVCVEGGAALPSMPEGNDWKKRYDARFPDQFQSYSPYTYDATKVLVDAMKRANSVDPKAYLPCLRRTNFKGLTGNISFEANGGLRSPLSTVYTFKDGSKNVLASLTSGGRDETSVGSGCGAGTGIDIGLAPRPGSRLPVGADQQTILGESADSAVKVVMMTPTVAGSKPLQRGDLLGGPERVSAQQKCDAQLSDTANVFETWRVASGDLLIQKLNVDRFWGWYLEGSHDEAAKAVATKVRASMSACYTSSAPTAFPDDLVSRVGAIAGPTGIRHCSGLRVGANVVLTARHCVMVGEGTDAQLVSPAELVKFRFYLAGETNGVAITAISKVGPPGPRLEDDWVLLSIAQLLTAPVEFPYFAESSAILPGTPMVTVGLVPPLDSSGVFTPLFNAGTSCQALYATSQCLAHTCNTVPGLSGAPLFALLGGKWAFVGVHSRPFGRDEWETKSCDNPAKSNLNTSKVNGGSYVRADMR